jgi:tetratricopeptide (TPR) repeat protein
MNKTRTIIIGVVVGFLLLIIGCGSAAFMGSRFISSTQERVELDRIAEGYETGDLEGSRDELLAFVETYPSNALAWTILGHVYQDLDMLDDAEAAYLQAIEVDAEAFEAYTGLGVVYRNRQDYEKAIEYYNKSLEINPDYAQAYSSLAVIELRRANDRKALELAEKAYDLDKEDPVIAANLAIAYHYNNNIEERNRMYDVAQQLGYDSLDTLQQIFSGELTIRGE